MNFFLDVDGTLLWKRSTPTRSFLAVMARAQSLGHRFFINTARPLAFASAEFPWDSFDGLCFGCGTNIRYRGATLYRRIMPLSELRYAVDTVLGAQPDVKLTLEGEDALYYSREVPFSGAYVMRPYSSFDELIKRYPDLRIQKLATYGGSLISKRTAEMLSETFDVYLHERYSELVPKGYDKGRAVRTVEDLLSVPHESTVAVGDSYNDLPMLKYCHISVAMGNAPDDVKRQCTDVTQTAEDDGAARAVARLCDLNYREFTE